MNTRCHSSKQHLSEIYFTLSHQHEAMTILENSTLKIAVKNNGAELCSLYNKQSQIEYLWQAGKEWPKHSPVLFPIVGQLKNNTYRYQDKTYTLERHGFARNLAFNVTEVKSDSIRLTLKEQDATLAVYPFHFILNISYQLHENTLKVIYEIVNTGKDSMPFSIGAHPAFNVPLNKGENYNDYFLIFNKTENAGRWLLQNGLLDSEVEFFKSSNQLPLTKELFSKDALVFKHLKSGRIDLRCKNHNHGVAVNFPGFPYMGIWAASCADFVCIEPWLGIADSIQSNGNIQEKEGIILLQPDVKFKAAYTIEVF